MAFSAISAVSAATNATRSPTKRTLLSSENVSSGPGIGSDWPAVDQTTRGISCHVKTAATPGKALALLTSISRMRACACGLCNTFATSIPRFSMSAVKAGLPCTSLTASTFLSGLPTTFHCSVWEVTTILGRVNKLEYWSPGNLVDWSSDGLTLPQFPKSQLIDSQLRGSSPLIMAAALRIAWTGFKYPVQRHNTPEMASRTSSSVGFGFFSSKHLAARICAGVQ